MLLGNFNLYIYLSQYCNFYSEILYVDKRKKVIKIWELEKLIPQNVVIMVQSQKLIPQ